MGNGAHVLALLAGWLLLAGCDHDDRDSDVAIFRLRKNELPYPTDIHFHDSTDGTLNIVPTGRDQTLTPIQIEMNTLDGFSTSSVIRERFSSPLDEKSLTGAAIRLVEVTIDDSSRWIVGIKRELVMGSDPASADFTARLAEDSDGSVLELLPLKPLSPSTTRETIGYLVILTDAIRTTKGTAVKADADYQRFRSMRFPCTSLQDQRARATCQAVASQLQTAASLGIDPDDIALTFSFSTQATAATLDVLAGAEATPAGRIAWRDTGLTTRDVSESLQGHAKVVVGTLQVPYYGALPSASNPAAPLATPWQAAPSPLDASSRFLTRFNPKPVATATTSIPLLVTVPNDQSSGAGVKPARGWPVVIFQHGLTRNRLDALALADSFADADSDLAAPGVQGFVVASIDLPLHGVAGADANTSNPFYDALNERTFNLDLIDNDKRTPGPDGKIDESGTHFINLSSLRTGRDNIRQSVSDLLALARSLPTLDLNGDGAADIDPTRIHFIGHSLGGIVGGVLLGVAPKHDVRTGELAMAGGGLVRTLFDSPQFGPPIKGILAAQGIQEGTPQFAEYARDAQTILDSADPLNFIASARARRPLLLLQVVGGALDQDGGLSPADQVILNSSTQRLIDAAKLTRISMLGENAATAGFVNFILGDHGSIIRPRANLATTVEMHHQSISFATSLGSTVHISDRMVVQP
jgi:hypothetical protein